MKKEYSKYYRIIYIFFILFIIFDLLSKYLYPALSLSYERLLVEWILRFCRDIFLSLAIAGLIIIGIYELRIYGFSFKKSLSAFVGIIMAIGMIFAMWFIEYRIDGLTKSLENSNYIVKFENILKDHTLPKKRREQISKIYAEMYYLRYEEKIKYFKNGKDIIFQPSKENDDQIAFMHEKKKQMASIRRVQYFWILLLFTSIAIGLFLPIRKTISKE